MTGVVEGGEMFGAATVWLETLAGAIDLLSIAVLLIGALRFVLGVIRGEASRDGERRLSIMNTARRELGSYILAGLELLIVSDVIHTAITLELDGLIFLGGLVLIRSVISFFLEREIESLSKAGAPER
ncbi:DUF1622 domain-containing protein [Pseudohoeflea coraliihabitans]|uniref:DUF1622 domain-containing protein n=1 Tax=Pseudohoeflea coraliihabitans TaxID=2860393 RepID=A0ABS6WIM5_9HYPH|nr:DUF1622 domain-containing protein [Pseudohoeflea sp. DP4N28-3]MBW3095788.1 DUF1622 domain-containing protein [Pseudohoeflea sp. DP4N28-3]